MHPRGEPVVSDQPHPRGLSIGNLSMAKKDKKNKSVRLNISKPVAAILVVFTCVAAVHLTKFVLGFLNNTPAAKSVLARSKGNPKAELRITEYIDLQCPACARGAKILKETFDRYPGDIYLELKYFPLEQMHQFAVISALYAECAARQNKFWEFTDVLLAKQDLWSPLTSAEPMFREIAHSVHINLEQLNSCLADKSVEEAVFKERDFGKSMGIKSTPTYYVNGTMVVGAKSLQEELDKHLGVSTNAPGGTSH